MMPTGRLATIALGMDMCAAVIAVGAGIRNKPFFLRGLLYNNFRYFHLYHNKLM